MYDQKNPNQQIADANEWYGDLMESANEEPYFDTDDSDYWDGEPWYRQIQDTRDFYARNNRDN